MLGMAIFAWSLNTPLGKFIDQTVSALIIFVVISTLGGCSALAFALLRAGLRWLAARPQRSLRKIAALPQFITGLLPLPLVFIGAGLALASQLYAWFPRLIVYLLTLQDPVISIVLIGAVFGMLAGIVMAVRPQFWPVRLLAFLPAAGLIRGSNLPTRYFSDPAFSGSIFGGLILTSTTVATSRSPRISPQA